jgi:hypothetical protein
MEMYRGVEVERQHSWRWHYVEVSGQLHALATLPPGKEPLVPIGWEAGWLPELVWTLQGREKSVAPSRNRTPAIRPIACCYTNDS